MIPHMFSNLTHNLVLLAPIVPVLIGLGCGSARNHRAPQQAAFATVADEQHAMRTARPDDISETYVIQDCAPEQPERKRDTRIIEVVGKSFVGPIDVRRGKITRLFFPSPILSASTNGARPFGISVNRITEDDDTTSARQIVINPTLKATSTILYVQTAGFEAILDIVAVGKQAHAHRYITFVSKDADALFEERFTRAIASELRPRVARLQELEDTYDELTRSYRRLAEVRAQKLLAHALWTDLVGNQRVDEWCAINHEAQTRDMILRAGWVRWVGNHAFVAFSVRGLRDVTVTEATLTASDGIARQSGHAYRHKDQPIPLAGGQRHMVVAGLADASTLAGDTVTLRVHGPGMRAAGIVSMTLPGPECSPAS